MNNIISTVLWKRRKNNIKFYVNEFNEGVALYKYHKYYILTTCKKYYKFNTYNIADRYYKKLEEKLQCKEMHY